jgi:hypothetical protein
MKMSRPSLSFSALHGRGRFFVGQGEEAVHARKAKLADSSDVLHAWRSKVFSSTSSPRTLR